MIRVSAWISLEPDAGTRKNNRYPDDRRPSAVSSSPPPPSSRKFVAAVNTPAIAEEEPFEATELERTALDPAAVSDTAAADASTEAAVVSTAKCRVSGDTFVGLGDARERAVGRGTAEMEGEGEGARGKRQGSTSSFGPASSSSPSSSTPTLPFPLPPHLPPSDAPSAALSQRPKAADDAIAANGVGNDVCDDDDDDHHQGRVFPTLTPTPTPTPNPPLVIGGIVRLLPNALSLTPVEKAKAARECKRLLDAGRRAFIEERLGLTSEIVHFVGKDITPENALLLGFRGE